MDKIDRIALAWIGVTSVMAFLLFAYDKWRAGRSGMRVPEFRLLLIGALGGWLGGLLAMLLFRHKTAKLAFQLKYAAAFLIWAGLIWTFHSAFTDRAVGKTAPAPRSSAGSAIPTGRRPQR